MNLVNDWRRPLRVRLTPILRENRPEHLIDMAAVLEKRAAQDAYVSEGTFLIAGGMPAPGAPTRGRFLQTLVRAGGRWLIAGDGAISPPRPAK